MHEVEHSRYIAEKRPVAEALLKELRKKYDYVSVLVTDSKSKNYRVQKSGISVGENHDFGGKGMVVRVYNGRSYAEYSTNEICMEKLPEILEKIEERLMTGVLPEGTEEAKYKALQDTPCTLRKATAYEIHPESRKDSEILQLLHDLRNKALAADDRLLDAGMAFEWQEYHKLFLSPNRDMEESVLLATANLLLTALHGEQVEMSYGGYSNLGGLEVLDQVADDIPRLVKNVTDLLHAEPMIPGTYECICMPEVTGMIAHEAFGHGVEMDMYVKDRALASRYIGKRVASDLVTMHDGCAENEVATYFFDDEGTLSQDTVIIRNGILQTGISDAQSALYLGTKPTGNGRRESYERKTYTRMTNTYFEPGSSTLEEMIASVLP